MREFAQDGCFQLVGGHGARARYVHAWRRLLAHSGLPSGAIITRSGSVPATWCSKPIAEQSIHSALHSSGTYRCTEQDLTPNFRSRVIRDWMQWYNQERPHQALGYRSPVQYRARQVTQVA
ncbi:MAG: transposase [Nitrospira sp.]|nr:transposase [Nitrospira sp.]